MNQLLAALSGILLVPAVYAQDAVPAETPAPAVADTSPPPTGDASQTPASEAPAGGGFRVGVGIKASLLGAGVEVAAPLIRNTDLRIGFNGAPSPSHDFHKDGIDYSGKLKLGSLTAVLDWFPFSGPFHLSAGLVYGSVIKIKAGASAPAGTSFSLNNVDYVSSADDPVSGRAKIDFRKIAPMVLLGWGSLVPYSNHFSVSFETGAIFSGAPRSNLNLRGRACASSDDEGGDCGAGSLDVATDSGIQKNIDEEENKLDRKARFFKIYPVLSLGFGYSFGV